MRRFVHSLVRLPGRMLSLSAAIHHGGCGTTAAVLRAGIPSLVVAFAFDQQLYGQRCCELGVAHSPLLHASDQLTSAALAAIIRGWLLDAEVRARVLPRCQALASKLSVATENGSVKAADWLLRNLHPGPFQRDSLDKHQHKRKRL